MVTYAFEDFAKRLPEIRAYDKKHDEVGFFLQETLRFFSIAGGLIQSGMRLDNKCEVDERYVSHVLIRSLLENYYVIIWLFDDPAETSARYQERAQDFAREYRALINSMNSTEAGRHFVENGSNLLPINALAVQPVNKKSVEGLITELRNANAERSKDQYIFYRITSFDVHGKSLAVLMETAFQQDAIMFPNVNVRGVIDSISDTYHHILDALLQAGRLTKS